MDTLLATLTEYGLAPLLNHLTALLALVEPDGKLVDWNPPFGFHKDLRASASTLYDLVIPDQHAQLQAMIRDKKNKTRRGSLKFIGENEDRPVLHDCRLTPLPNGRLLFLAEIAHVEEIQRLNDELTRARAILEETKRTLHFKEIELQAVIAQADEVSHTDALTYLPNRRQVINSLQKEAHRAERYKTHFSISMLDIDHFKKVNDSFGHTIGDQVLFQLANMLREGIRESDMVGRYGGEEFLILLPNTVLPKAVEQAERLCRQVRETDIDVGKKIRLTVSIGVAEYKVGMENWQQFLSRADMALYDAKNSGRDRWAVTR